MKGERVIVEDDKNGRINVLLNINNYFGEHGSRLTPILIFLGIVCVPPIIWLFGLRGIIGWKFGLFLELLIVARAALFIFGHENEKLEIYMQAREDKYAAAEDIIRISNIYSDGLIEYSSGKVAYIISCFCMGYFNDDSFSIDMEDFLMKLKDYQYDVYCHTMYDEFELSRDLVPMSVYTDKELMEERMSFYIAQDEYCNKNTKLYRIDIVVKDSKYNRKSMKDFLDLLVTVDTDLFKQVYICDQEQAGDVISRNLGTVVDIEQMLVTRYKNEEYRGSEVLYYDDELPDSMRTEKETPKLESRRVRFKEG